MKDELRSTWFSQGSHYLPADVSDFLTIRTNNYIYVDKTEHIYNLFKPGASRYYFLSRPRRFGKTLLIWTLKELFSANRPLFKNLWIDRSDYEWVEYPVIYLDFSALVYETKETLVETLGNRLDTLAHSYGLTLKFRFAQEKLVELIEHLALKNKVVILIDEYDKPILRHLADKERALEIREFLSDFYGVFKSMSHNIRAMFITGVTKFSKTSLFSGLNNLNDLTIDPRAASLLGYTDEEIDRYFPPFIEETACYNNLTKEVTRKKMRTWYNGYRFSKLPCRVYNPFSILYLFDKREFANYWFESGTSSFLIDLLKEKYELLSRLTEYEISPSSLGAFTAENIPFFPLLFQTGYLTIASHNQETGNFKLGYPNEEVEESFKKYVVTALSNADSATVENILSQLVAALKEKNLDYVCLALKLLFSHIPYHLHIEQESYYHSLFQIFMSLISINSQSETPTDKGRIDAVICMPDRIYIFEFKLNASAESALKQILDKEYYQRFLLQPKPLTLVGLSFSCTPEGVTVSYVAQDMNPSLLR